MEHLTKDELHNLLTVARAASEHDYVMILTAYAHGLRASEVCGLTAEQVRNGFLSVQRLKGSLHTVQPLVHSDDPLLDERAALTAWMQGKTGRLFSIGRKMFCVLFQKYVALAGIPAHKQHPHSLKHSVAMHNIHTAGIEMVTAIWGTSPSVRQALT